MSICLYYICDSCQHTWSLEWTHVSIGPIAWGSTRFDCLSCLTAVDIPKQLEPRQWAQWKSDNRDLIHRSEQFSATIAAIDSLVAGNKPYDNIKLTLSDLKCPTCGDETIDNRVENQLMKCPACRKITGRYDGTSFNPIRCTDCGHLSFAHRYENVAIICERCKTGSCVNVDPDELIADGT